MTSSIKEAICLSSRGLPSAPTAPYMLSAIY